MTRFIAEHKDHAEPGGLRWGVEPICAVLSGARPADRPIDLLLHRHMASADVVAGLTAEVTVGASTADVVAVEARKHPTDTRGGQPTPNIRPVTTTRLSSGLSA